MFAEPIKKGIRQTERWMFAAQQDAHPFVMLLHANYAVGNIDLLRQMYSDDEIMRVTGKNINQLAQDAQQLQDRAQGRIQTNVLYVE